MKQILAFSLIMICASNMYAQDKFNYSAYWKNIDRLIEDGLPRSALPEIEKVYQAALKDKSYGQLIKAVIKRTDCQRLTEENPQIAIINRLKQDVETIPSPAKEIIYSFLGEAHLDYYSRNRRSIYGRTALSEEVENDDIETWDATRLISETENYYRLSLTNTTALQETPVGEYKDALEGDAATRNLRPTLYDLLAHRMIDAYMKNDLAITDFSIPFVMEDVGYFGDAQTFSQLTLLPADSSSTDFLITKLFQELTVFRLAQKDINALADVDIKRLKYVKSKARIPDPDKLYEDALEHLIISCAGQKIWGKAAYTLAVQYNQRGSAWEYDKNSDTRHYLVKAAGLCREIEKKAGLKEDRKYASDMLKELEKPELNIQTEKELVPGKPVLARIRYRNTQTAYLSIYSYNEAEFNELSRNDKNSFGSFISRQTRIRSQKIDLPVQSDLQRHSVEWAVDSLPAAGYLLVLSDKSDPAKSSQLITSYAPLQVTSVYATYRSLPDKTTEIYVTDRYSGLPLPDVDVRLWNQKQPGEVSGIQTDSNGIALAPAGVNRAQIIFNGDSLHIQLYESYYREAEPRTNIVFFTDRAIYRPGQTLYFKGLRYRTDDEGNNTILPGPHEKVAVRLLDVNRREIAQQEFTVNDFGSFNGTFSIPQGLLNGEMRLETTNGSAGFRVEEYKRPTFEVRMQDIGENYRPGDSVTFKGEAGYYAGYPLDEAQVAYKVTRQMQFYPFPRRFIFPPAYFQQQLVAAGTIKTDLKGNFSVTFKTEKDNIAEYDPVYIYELTVDVTDINGETQSTGQMVSVGRKPLRISTDIPVQIDAGTADSLKYALNVTNLNGISIASTVQIEVFPLQGPDRILRNRLWEKPDTFILSRHEFEHLFPADPYGNEDDPSTYPLSGRLAAWSLTTTRQKENPGIPAKNNGVIDLSLLKNAASGWYLVKMEATAEGTGIRDSVYIRLRQPEAPITRMDEWLTAVNDKVRTGDTAVFLLAGNGESHIRYDILAGGRIVERNSVEAGNIPRVLRIPVRKEWSGDFAVQFAMIRENRLYTSLQTVKIIDDSKKLDIAFTSFRDRLLPGGKEKWILTVKNKDKQPEPAEMVAALYDASLDAFVPHQWRIFFESSRSYWNFQWKRMQTIASGRFAASPESYYFPNEYNTSYEMLNFPSISMPEMYIRGSAKMRSMASENEVVELAENVVEDAAMTQTSGTPPLPAAGGKQDTDLTQVSLRTNFSETAFFYPELRTNEKGEIAVEFTVPDALTRWNMLGFAHTKDFKTGSVTNSLVTQKQVSVNANLPRFLRYGDTLVLSARVSNLTDKDLDGKALLRLYDAYNMQEIGTRMLKTSGTQSFTVKAGQSASVQWKLAVPATLQALTCRLTAEAGGHTDGEERSIPVITNRTLITESMPFMVRGEQKKDFRFDRLLGSESNTLQNYRLTLEYSATPIWYAIQAIPYLMEYPYECSEQVFSRFYANSLATVVANSSPRIREVFDQWRTLPDDKSLLSNLEKNQELKQALLEETPWVMQAANETERKKRIALLFDLNRMAHEQQKALDKLKSMQGNNGAFPWFAGQPDDRFITQHIVTGLEHLRKLYALPASDDINDLIKKAMEYCDARIAEDYNEAVKKSAGRTERSGRERRQIGRQQLHYLYMCSFSKHRPLAVPQAFDFYIQQVENYWARLNLYEQAMAALVMHRFGKPDVAQVILRSLKERAQEGDETGMYWADNKQGYSWHESQIETQAMLIEAFNEVGADSRAVEEMQIWLLRNKQVNDWKTTKATSEAVYALLISGDYALTDSQPLDIRINGKPLKKVVKEPLRPEAGTGHVKTTWNGDEIRKNMGNLRVTNPNTHMAWGAMYWQYFEDLDQVSSSGSGLNLDKQLFIKQNTDKGIILLPVSDMRQPRTGDIVTVRIELRADRDFEYVHLKDMRAAGFEPVSILSGYRFKNGLGYYEDIRDAAVNFFISSLRKGVYVFEYDLRVSNAGNFSNGIATIQSMYAPEFNAHSKGIRVKAE